MSVANPNSHSGFTLVEVLIACAVLVIFALTAASVMGGLQGSNAASEKSQAAVSLVNLVREKLRYSNLCESAIGGSSTLNQGTINLLSLNAGTQEIKIKIPNIQAGMSMTDDFIGQGSPILPKRLQINSIKLKDVVLLGPVGSPYTAAVEMSIAPLNGKAYKPFTVGTIQIVLTGTSPHMNILSCNGLSSGVTKNVCETMGCIWDTALTPSCRCLAPNSLCPLGEYPIAFKGGIPDCRPLGGVSCAPGRYLVGVELEKSICSPMPPAPPTSLPVNCVGSWGACGGGPPAFRTYTWTTLPLNGGTVCATANGQTDTSGCGMSWHALGSYTTCNGGSACSPGPHSTNTCPASWVIASLSTLTLPSCSTLGATCETVWDPSNVHTTWSGTIYDDHGVAIGFLPNNTYYFRFQCAP